MPGPAQPFPKGTSGNPGGRPRKTEEMRKAEELMRSRCEDGVRDLILLSETSEDDAVRAKLLVFRYEAVFGKPTQRIAGDEEQPLQIAMTGDDARLELARAIAGLAARLDAGAGDGDAQPASGEGASD